MQDELVLCARRAGVGLLAGLWEFRGGKVEHGESPTRALEREILEELGCEVRATEHVTTTLFPYAFGAVELSTYRCELLSCAPQALVHSELRWLASTELDAVNWAPADIPTVQALQLEEID